MDFVISTNGIKIEEKSIKVIKYWLEPKSVSDIQVFLSFANFYGRFIKNFSSIARLLILILETTKIADG